MSSITSSYAGQYYQLPSNAGGTTALPTSANAANTSLLSTNGTANTSLAYLLDLSPEAQNYLNNGAQSATTDPTAANSSFTISPQDQQKIDAILEKYKDAPLTQDTYNQIQNDLTTAGLSPQQLAQKDTLTSFSATRVLIDALNGIDDPIPSASSTDEQTKSTNYMQQIYKQWQSVASASTASS